MSQQHPQYQIGDVVNGHRWTGVIWEPVAPAESQLPPAGGPPPVKKAWYTKWWVIGLLAFAVIVVLAGIFGGGDDQTATSSPAPDEVATQPAADEPADEQTTKKSEPVDEQAEEAEPAEPAAGVGDAVRDGKFEFTVTNVETGVDEVGDEFLSSQAQGSYTLVAMTVENIGEEAQTFFSDNVTGTDSKGRELASDSEAGIYANEDNTGWIEEINPGNSIEAIVVFDVAKGADLLAINVHDSAFSGGAQISLE